MPGKLNMQLIDFVYSNFCKIYTFATYDLVQGFAKRATKRILILDYNLLLEQN